MNKFN